jgi:hypothetical protein
MGQENAREDICGWQCFAEEWSCRGKVISVSIN